MSVNSTETGNQGQQTQAVDQRHTGSNDQPQPAVVSATKSWRNPSSLTKRIGNRNLHSEYVSQSVQKLSETIAQAIDSTEFDFDVTALPEESNLGIAVVTVVVRAKKQNSNSAAYFSLLLEKTASPLLTRQEQIQTPHGTLQVDVLRVTGDRYNVAMRNAIEKHLARLYPNTKLIPADGTRVPARFNPTDTNMVNSIAIASYFAAGTILEESSPNYSPFNLAEVSKDAQLQLKPIFGSSDEINAVGDPVRSDVTLSLFSQAVSNSGILGEDTTQELYRLNAYVDFMYMPQDPVAQYGQPPKVPSQKYLPRIIITKAESFGPMTLAFNLLGVAQAAALLQPAVWMQVFLQRGHNVREIQDIAYMNVEANLEENPSGFGVPAETNSDEELVTYLGRFARTDVQPLLSQDIPLFGPETWYLSPLLAAARGNEAASKAVYKALCGLTNNHITKYLQPNQKFVVTSGEQIHLGNYPDEKGNPRDIRDVDLNAVLARFHHTDPAMGAKWAETFFATNVNEIIRQSDRKKIIEGVCGGQVEFTGTAERINFTPLGVAALLAACADVGLEVKNVMQYANLNGTQRSRAPVDQSFLAPVNNQQASFFKTGIQTASGNTWGGPTTASRWG